jgi:hypothetical protein
VSPLDRASARQRLAPRDAFPRMMTICDGLGGSLDLDLDCRELEALTFACRCLLDGMAPPGASLIKVTAGDEVYLVSHPQPADDSVCLQIVSLYQPTERVRLTWDLAQLVVALIEQGLLSRHGLSSHD